VLALRPTPTRHRLWTAYRPYKGISSHRHWAACERSCSYCGTDTRPNPYWNVCSGSNPESPCILQLVRLYQVLIYTYSRMVSPSSCSDGRLDTSWNVALKHACHMSNASCGCNSGRTYGHSRLRLQTFCHLRALYLNKCCTLHRFPRYTFYDHVLLLALGALSQQTMSQGACICKNFRTDNYPTGSTHI